VHRDIFGVDIMDGISSEGSGGATVLVVVRGGGVAPWMKLRL
jgi:hypothetical protein